MLIHVLIIVHHHNIDITIHSKMIMKEEQFVLIVFMIEMLSSVLVKREL